MSSTKQLERQTEAPIADFLIYFLCLGTVGFGGPIALAGRMQSELVEERGWIRNEDYLEGLALAQLAPGPLAAQLAVYLGYVRAGILGATGVAVAFIAPSFVMVLLISVLYQKYGGLPWMQSLFYGIGAAVVGILLRSVSKLSRVTLKKDKLLWSIAIVLAVSTAYTGGEIVWRFYSLVFFLLLSNTGPGRFLLLYSPFHLQRFFSRCTTANIGASSSFL
jgi:chromate transporter